MSAGFSVFWNFESDTHVITLSLRELSTGKFEYLFDRLLHVDGYDAATFEERALAGDVTAAIAVLARASLKPEIRSALLTDDAHDEIRFGIMARSDVTPEELHWAAETTESTFVLNRIAAHGKVSVNTLRSLQRRSEGRTEPVWLYGSTSTPRGCWKRP